MRSGDGSLHYNGLRGQHIICWPVLEGMTAQCKTYEARSGVVSGHGGLQDGGTPFPWPPHAPCGNGDGVPAHEQPAPCTATVQPGQFWACPLVFVSVCACMRTGLCVCAWVHVCD